MDFDLSARAVEYRSRLQDFVTTTVEPATPVYWDQVAASGDPHFAPPVMEDLKAEARRRGLWNLFLPSSGPNGDEGAGLSNLEYAPLCEIMGRAPPRPRTARHPTRATWRSSTCSARACSRSSSCGRCSTARCGRASR